jgi:hypothetical protein
MVIHLSSRASLSLARGKPGRYSPYHRPATKTLGPSDSKYVTNNARNKRNNVSSKKYVDLDYSYERMELRDRLLDMNPAPPPYADVSTRPDLDIEPVVPAPVFIDDAYNDDDEPKDPNDEPKDPNDEPKDPNDEPKDPNDEPKDPNGDTTMTKEKWETAWKREDGTYDTSLLDFGASETTFATLNAQTYEWFKQYLMYEMNYVFPNEYGYFDENTKFKIERVTDENGVENIEFHFRLSEEKGGGNAWYSIPSRAKNQSPGTDTNGDIVLTPEQQHNVDKGAWDAIYVNPATTGYVLPNDVLLQTQNPKGQVLSDASWKWLTEYASFLDYTQLSDTLNQYGRNAKIFVTRYGNRNLAVQIMKPEINRWTDPHYINTSPPTEEMSKDNGSIYSQEESHSDWVNRWYNSTDNFWYIPKSLDDQHIAAYKKQVPLTLDEPILSFLKNEFLTYNTNVLDKNIADRMDMNTPFTLELNIPYTIVRWNDSVYGHQVSYIKTSKLF